jgi:nucleotide-binding universal stress UspA family protein
MTKPAYRIICGVDGSAGSDRALELVGALPVRPGDEVIVASRPAYLFAARAGGEGIIARASEAARERAHVNVDAGVARLAARGLSARGVVCEGEDPVDGLIRVAEQESASLIVVGSRGLGPWTSIVLGSTARALAITCPVPVLIVREHAVAPLRVLAAVDGSPSARAALAAFARVPQSEGAVVELLHVLPVHAWPTSTLDWDDIGKRTDVERDEERRSDLMLGTQRGLLQAGVEIRVRHERGHVGETILRRAAEIGADLVVIGTRGLEGPRHLFYGSTAERVLAQARANVLVGPATSRS